MSIPVDFLAVAQKNAVYAATLYEDDIRSSSKTEETWTVRWPKIKGNFHGILNGLRDANVCDRYLVDKIGPFMEKYWYQEVVPPRTELLDIIQDFDLTHPGETAMRVDQPTVPQGTLSRGLASHGDSAAVTVDKPAPGKKDKGREPKGTIIGKGKAIAKDRKAKAQEKRTQLLPSEPRKRKRKDKMTETYQEADNETEGSAGEEENGANVPSAQIKGPLSTRPRKKVRIAATPSIISIDGHQAGNNRRLLGSEASETPTPNTGNADRNYAPDIEPIGLRAMRSRTKSVTAADPPTDNGTASIKESSVAPEKQPPPLESRIDMSSNPCLLCVLASRPEGCFLEVDPKASSKRACWECRDRKRKCTFTENGLLQMAAPVGNVYQKLNTHMTRSFEPPAVSTPGFLSNAADADSLIQLLSNENTMLRGELQGLKLQISAFISESKKHEQETLIRISRCVEDSVFAACDRLKQALGQQVLPSPIEDDEGQQLLENIPMGETWKDKEQGDALIGSYGITDGQAQDRYQDVFSLRSLSAENAVKAASIQAKPPVETHSPVPVAPPMQLPVQGAALGQSAAQVQLEASIEKEPPVQPKSSIQPEFPVGTDSPVQATLTQMQPLVEAAAPGQAMILQVGPPISVEPTVQVVGPVDANPPVHTELPLQEGSQVQAAPISTQTGIDKVSSSRDEDGQMLPQMGEAVLATPAAVVSIQAVASIPPSPASSLTELTDSASSEDDQLQARANRRRVAIPSRAAAPSTPRRKKGPGTNTRKKNKGIR